MVEAIEKRLTGDCQWLGGQQPSKEDAEQFTALGANVPDASKHPNAFGWYMLVSRFDEEVRASWTVGAPAPKEAAPKKGGDGKKAGGGKDAAAASGDAPAQNDKNKAKKD